MSSKKRSVPYRPRGEYRAKWDMAHRSKKEYYRSAIRAEEREIIDESDDTDDEEYNHEDVDSETDEEASTGFYLRDVARDLRHHGDGSIHR